ncbi:hypothetical protein JRO89_XS07G0029100 [Xanthoceras sorbifolium]|uniref:FHA domain-containing protein n=1 Tax=Xanthoceras sorbifolium TaxID=99658 RepID=A0ABQ8HS37_9ROSI|nr:hypothetical protein JRO89_XS07G0029100 [Xanthoceras sorbifolium]
MGALAPVSSWLPEDDLLLKNSIEAGASLESLAKGAVQFSRKFSVQELHDRWYSLLYDPVVSAEASIRMIEFERSALTLQSKFSRAGISKENKRLSRKRKAKSVRSCYYALRKRIRNEPFSSMDLSFLVAPGNDDFFGNGDEPLSGNCILGDPMSNHFGLQESHLDIMDHSFPPISADGGTSSRDGHIALGFHGGLDHAVEDGFTMQQHDMHKEIPHIFEENQSYTGNGCGVEDLGQPQHVPGMFETGHLEANPPSAYGQMNSGPGNVCSDFDGNQVFHSPIPECGASFPNLEYSSPLPEMPTWRTVEDISSPSIPVEDSRRENVLHTADTFALTDDADVKDKSTPGCDFVHADSELKMQMPCDELKCPAGGAEGYLAELSNSLLNFNDEELMTLDDAEKGMIDKSFFDGLNLLLNSPNDVNQDHMPSPEPNTSVTPDYLTNASSSCPVEAVENVQTQSSASASDCQFPELIDGIICCTLNTEDPEIPCNDDVFFPNKLQPVSVSAAARRNLKEAGNLICSSVKDFSGNKKLTDGGPVLMQREKENLAQSQVSSQMMGSQVIPENGQLHPVGDSGVKFGLPNCDSPHLAPKKPGIACGGSSQSNSMNICRDSHQPARLKEDNKDVASVKNIGRTLTDSFMEKPAFGSDSYKWHERNASGVKKEFDDPATIQDCQASNANLGSTNMPDSEPDVSHPISEPEEPPIESDDDVPYYSDIEAMILDMDLDPDDQDIYEQEVSKYQNEDTRRAIIRLEQGAHSYMQRTIASHGAFAILYGRHSKHYIKKPEVLLGRATEDVVVDIDLGREGRANKISRRQAIIKMEKGGSFHIKNLGRCSISVNDKEVAPGQSLSLTSSCMIEIRGLPFIFETNQTCVKQYFDSITTENQNQEHQI